jgi:hypothetical protein
VVKDCVKLIACLTRNNNLPPYIITLLGLQSEEVFNSILDDGPVQRYLTDCPMSDPAPFPILPFLAGGDVAKEAHQYLRQRGYAIIQLNFDDFNGSTVQDLCRLEEEGRRFFQQTSEVKQLSAIRLVNEDEAEGGRAQHNGKGYTEHKTEDVGYLSLFDYEIFQMRKGTEGKDKLGALKQDMLTNFERSFALLQSLGKKLLAILEQGLPEEIKKRFSCSYDGCSSVHPLLQLLPPCGDQKKSTNVKNSSAETVVEPTTVTTDITDVTDVNTSTDTDIEVASLLRLVHYFPRYENFAEVHTDMDNTIKKIVNESVTDTHGVTGNEIENINKTENDDESESKKENKNERDNENVNNSSDENIVFEDHTDFGLLTLVSISSVPALEIWDQTEQQWIPIEQLINAHLQNANNLEEKQQPVMLLVFGGETLQQASLGYYKALRHRVVVPARTGPRLATIRGADREAKRRFGRVSAPFFLRAQPDARIPCIGQSGCYTVRQFEVDYDRQQNSTS